jgi:hypothetical protein
MERSGTQSNPGAPGVLLDVRSLPPPDDILAVLKKAGELANGSAMEFLIGSNPFQLYDLLQQRGYILEMQPERDGSFRGLIKPRDRVAAAH